tara:strand:+ start:82 stop:747 length:666 start_codon:yes stop_codon:yes gene_type:complete
MTDVNIKINLESDGYKITRENLFNINNETLDEFFEIFEKEDLPNHGNFKNIKVIKNVNQFKFLKKIFSELKKILQSNSINYKFEDVWAQKSEYINSRPGELPFIPHIDKLRKFKIMVYLNNVHRDSGPIHFIKCKPGDYENFRKNLSKTYQIDKENEIKDFDISKYENCSGPVGTTIFFDTNCPHFAGEIKQENSDSRYIYRFNFSMKDYNFFQKLLKNIF